jgi:hypothetical protein
VLLHMQACCYCSYLPAPFIAAAITPLILALPLGLHATNIDSGVSQWVGYGACTNAMVSVVFEATKRVVRLQRLGWLCSALAVYGTRHVSCWLHPNGPSAGFTKHAVLG